MTSSISEDEKDWNPKMEDVAVSSREVKFGKAVSRFDPRPDPVTDLKNRLSTWGMLPSLAIAR